MSKPMRNRKPNRSRIPAKPAAVKAALRALGIDSTDGYIKRIDGFHDTESNSNRRKSPPSIAPSPLPAEPAAAHCWIKTKDGPAVICVEPGKAPIVIDRHGQHTLTGWIETTAADKPLIDNDN